jgi:hypothetical protein
VDPISLAFGLAKFAPDVIRWITGDDKSAKVAEKIVDVAKAVTGNPDPVEAIAAVQASPELQLQFQQSVMAINADLEKAYLADMQSARQRDTEFMKAGKHNYRADVLAVVAVGAVLALTYAIWTDPTINEFLKGTVTLVLGRFLGYIDQIYSFEFGTTRSSGEKTKLLAQSSPVK